MEALLRYIATGDKNVVSVGELKRIVARYPWFTVPRVALMSITAETTPSLDLRLAVKPLPGILLKRVTNADLGFAVQQVKSFERIEHFLSAADHRISPDERVERVDISGDSVAEDPDLISEELAEIYLAQGLKNKAKEIYMKLSLRDSEKSVYFAEIIDRINAE